MKRFFFDIDCAGLKTVDESGTSCLDAVTAIQELLASVRETADGALRGAENMVVKGSVREEGSDAFFECQIELRSRWLS